MSARALLFVLVAAVLLPGCSALGYYAQAVSGQFELYRRTQPVAKRLDDPATPPELKVRLARALAIREFASRELALPDNASYRGYADLGRPYVVWNVFAAPEFSLQPVKSCFPFAGCVSYRGWFAQADAERHAAGLRGDGYDVYVGGVPAYSTLGWFDDPLLNTFINYPEGEVARLIFHELAHQLLYVRDDTPFNESFAVTVEQEGVRRLLDKSGTPGERAAYEGFQARRRGFLALVMKYRLRLEVLYHQRIAPEEMRVRKAEAFAQMQTEYETLKASWGGFPGYDRFFAQALNNAHLVSIAAYTELVPAFQALLAANGGDLPKFYAAARALAKLPKEERNAKLAGLVETPQR